MILHSVAMGLSRVLRNLINIPYVRLYVRCWFLFNVLHTSVFEPLINDYRHNTTKHASAYGIDNITWQSTFRDHVNEKKCWIAKISLPELITLDLRKAVKSKWAEKYETKIVHAYFKFRDRGVWPQTYDIFHNSALFPSWRDPLVLLAEIKVI